MLKFVQMFKLFAYLFILLCLIVSCSGPANDFEKQAELQYLDTLGSRLNGVKNLLDKVDLADIKDRQDIIQNNYQFCELKLKEKAIEPDEEMARLLQEYRALERLYSNTIATYPGIVMKLEELYLELKTLKESANAKDYNKEVFKTYFNKEKEEVLQLHKAAQNTLKLCVEAESVFTRRQQEIEELAEALKK